MYALKVQNRRVLVPIGEACAFGCAYCYALSDAIRAHTTDAAEIIAAVKAIPADRYDILQLGFDGDPLASRQRFFELMPSLLNLGKHLNISTKGRIVAATREFFSHLGERRQQISAFVSFSCWESASRLEPRTPSPPQRVETVQYFAQELKLPTFVALRPILPNVADKELEMVIRETASAGARAVIAGPLYLDPDGAFSGGTDSSADGAPVRVPWSPVDVEWIRCEDSQRLATLRSLAGRLRLGFYTSSVTAIREATGVRSVRQDHVRSA